MGFHVQISHRELGVVLDEAEAGVGLLAHQPFDQILDIVLALGDGDAGQGALLRIHGGLLQLGGHHLAQALEAADLGLLVLEDGGQQFVLVGVVAGVFGLLPPWMR
jgi:hypothetical protein